jgi:hypothetical protein
MRGKACRKELQEYQRLFSPARRQALVGARIRKKLMAQERRDNRYVPLNQVGSIVVTWKPTPQPMIVTIDRQVEIEEAATYPPKK